MADHAQPIWNRHLLPIDEAHEILEKASFRLQLPDNCRGTGFFISKDGWALTADHNLRKPKSRRVNFTGLYKGKELKFRYHKDSSSQHADIALMKIAQELPAGLEIDHLKAVFLDPGFPMRVRMECWRGRTVCVFGYPVMGGTHTETWFIDGMINTTDPISRSMEETSESGTAVVREYERLRIIGTGTGTPLGGISGAAVFDQESRTVIAVQGAQSNIAFDSGNIRASEIAQLIDRFPDLPSRTGAFHPIFRSHGDGLPEGGIAALARPRGAPVPVIVPISARFMPSEVPSGNLTFENESLNRLAQEAVLWAGEYARRFTGRLQQVFLGAHWGHGRPSGCALFHMPTADYEPSPPLLAGLVLAYFTRAFYDILAYEVRLAVEFPRALFVAAAGFKDNDPAVYGEEGLADAFRRTPINSQPFILFSRNQKDDLGLLAMKYSGLPIDEPEHMVESLLAELVKEIEAAVKGDLSSSFEADLGRLLEKEEELKQAQDALLNKEVRLSRIWAETKALEKQVAHLRSKIDEILVFKAGQKPMPNPDAILDEFDEFREKVIRECTAEEECDDKAPPVIFTDADTEEKKHACKRLYRHLSKFCHPDSVASRSTWFIHLKEHDNDLEFLEAMQAFLDPLAEPFRQSKVTDTLSDLFEHLFRLRDTRDGIHKKNKKIALDIDAFGVEWQKQVDKEIEELEGIRKMRQFDLNLEMNRLIRLLGGKEIGKIFPGRSNF